MEKTILLVEDEENDVFFLKRALKKADVHANLQVVRDGQCAIDYLEGRDEHSDRTRFPIPSLVLLDLKLPHVMGLEVLQWIRHQPEFGGLIVLILTSSRLEQDIDQAYRIGANGYLVKPSTPEEMLEIVQSIKQFWFEHNQLPSVSRPAMATHASV
ncbi:MAG: two-component system response regulator [Verrucomicrobiales bacterium]|nr:two-component system response regulator [Verrucomicrobiales bacterium]